MSFLNASPCFPKEKTACGTRTGKRVGVGGRLEMELTNVKHMFPRTECSCGERGLAKWACI